MKLSIELVPQTCWYTNVRSNVSKKTWVRLQKEVFHKAKYACEICLNIGSKHSLECHEVWEYDDNRCVQKLKKLIALCPACHEVKHIGLAMQKGRTMQALKWFCKINKMEPNAATAYVVRAFKKNEIRGMFQWELDLSLLSDHQITIGVNNKELHHT